MKQPDWLRVPGNGHGHDDALWVRLDHFDAQPFGKLAEAERFHCFEHLIGVHGGQPRITKVPAEHESTSSRVLLVDGHSLAYRAFYALPVENFSTTTGQPTNAVYGFTSMLLNTLRDENPTHVAVAFDVSRTTFRTERYPEYKGTRAASPDGFHGQVELIKEVLAALGINVFSVDGFEADDVIATLAKRCTEAGIRVEILTGDRDTFQLVNDEITVLYPMRGVSELARMTPEAITAKYGLGPQQYADFAALRGDPSDNLPGIPGVGEKTAAKWITTYGNLAELVAHADEVTGKVGDALRTSIDAVLLNRSLITLVSDVPIDVDVDALERVPVSPAPIDALFETLQFRALRDRLNVVVTQSEDTVALISTPTTADVTLREFREQRANDASIAVWFEGNWGAGRGSVSSVALATQTTARAVITTVAEFADVADLLANPAVPVIAHHVKGPLLDPAVQIANLQRDTALAAYLISPGSRSYDLDALVPGMAAATTADQLMFDEVHEASAVNAVAVHELAAQQEPVLEERGLLPLLCAIEQPVTMVLAQMERTGIAIDRTHFEDLSARFGSQAQAAVADAHAAAGHEFNVGSPKQLQEVLFTELGLPKTKKIKTGYTTDAEALNGLLSAQNPQGVQVVQAVLRWRDVTKLKQTVDGLLPLASTDGRVHTTFAQTVAATGRLSSLEPNLQNIPVRTEAGREIRAGFVAGPDAEGLLTADYSQIEMRIMAHLSRDEALIAAFAAGEDLHTSTAAMVFGVAPEAVDAELRRRIKAVSYGLVYGQSAYGLATGLGISQSEASELMAAYFERFGGVRDYLADVVEQARRSGYTETMFGRRRYLPDLTSDNRQRREMAERMALNAPIQGTAADIMKVAMLNVARGLEAGGFKSALLLQVHDELVLEVAHAEREPLTKLVISAMGAAASLDVALEVGVGFGPNWADAAH